MHEDFQGRGGQTSMEHSDRDYSLVPRQQVPRNNCLHGYRDQNMPSVTAGRSHIIESLYLKLRDSIGGSNDWVYNTCSDPCSSVSSLSSDHNLNKVCFKGDCRHLACLRSNPGYEALALKKQ